MMTLIHYNYIIINHYKIIIPIAINIINLRYVRLGLAFVVVVACEGFVGKSYCSGYIT